MIKTAWDFAARCKLKGVSLQLDLNVKKKKRLFINLCSFSTAYLNKFKTENVKKYIFLTWEIVIILAPDNVQA